MSSAYRKLRKAIAVVGPLYLEEYCAVDDWKLVSGEEYVVRSWSLQRRVGGSAVNVARSLSRLGVPTIIIGVWSPTWTPRETAISTSDECVDWRTIDSKGPAGRSLGIRMRDGDALFVTDVGSNALLSAEDVLSRLGNGDDLAGVLLCGVAKLKTLQGEVHHLTHYARRKNIKVGIDVGRLSYPPSRSLLRNLRGSLKTVDLFLPNVAEFKAIFGEKTRWDRLVPSVATNNSGLNVVLKMGPRGAAFIGNGEIYRVSAVPTKESGRNLVGAGDALNAAFVAEHWGKSRDPEIALRRAVKFATAHVQKK